jgi:hypothetical protein
MLKSALTFTVVIALSSTSTMSDATVPPEVIELTSANFGPLGFACSVYKTPALSNFELKFPPQLMDRLVPHSTDIDTMSLGGDLLHNSTNWVGQDHRFVMSKFADSKVDVAISVGFCRQPGSSACKVFRVKSVTKFIQGRVCK